MIRNFLIFSIGITILITTLSIGCKKDKDSEPIVPPPPPLPPTYDFTADTTLIDLNEVIYFTDLSSITSTSWLWDFGDGTTDTVKSPRKSYMAIKDYTVSLTVTNPEDTQTIIKDDYIKVVSYPSPWVYCGIASNYNLQDVFFIDKNTGWTVSLNGVILKTTDGGTNWSVLSSSTYSISGIHFINASEGWAVGNGTILRTTDGGATWTYSNFGVNIKDVYFINSYTGWIIGDKTIFMTTDTGSTWYIQYTSTRPLYEMHILDNDTGYVSGGSGTVLKTTDGGNTWLELNTSSQENLLSISVVNDDIWAVGYYGEIIHSKDCGLTWENQYHKTGITFESVCFTNSRFGWAVTSQDFCFYKTTNGGITWSHAQDPLIVQPYALYKLFFLDSKNGWVVGDLGIIYKLNL